MDEWLAQEIFNVEPYLLKSKKYFEHYYKTKHKKPIKALCAVQKLLSFTLTNLTTNENR